MQPYDLSPLRQLIKADHAAKHCRMCLLTPPTGAGLGDGAFISQDELNASPQHEREKGILFAVPKARG